MNINDAIATERIRQDKLWGVQNHGSHLWLAILVEEVGEVSSAILENSEGSGTLGSKALSAEWMCPSADAEEKIRGELIQVAAVAIAWLECIDRRTKP